VARMSDIRPEPPAAYPASASGQAAHAADGWSQDAGRQMLAQPGRDAGRALRILALIAVAVGLAALTAAACVLSYSSVHHLAIQAGVHGRLAGVYPLIFDAILVVAGCSVLALRGAGLVSRLFSWLCMLVLLAALAAGGALRAEAVKIPHKIAALVAAIVPWALVLIGFGLLVALLRYARLRRLGKRNGQQRPTVNGRPTEVVRSMVGAPIIPVTEGERQDTASQRPLIPGLPPRPQAIAVAEPSPAEQAADGNGSPTAAAAASGTGAEPPTVPNPTAVPAPASITSELQATGQDQPAVRRAEMQLRARTPKPAAQDAAEGRPPAQGWPTPFMPKVAQQGAPASQDLGSQKDAGVQQDVAVQPDESAQEVGAAQQDDGARQDNSAQAEDGAGPDGGGSAEEEADGLPALRRTRSSPTPPKDA
jgi:Protein of unknown function (DUF2637)